MGSNQNIAVRVQDSSTHQMQVQCSILGADQQHVLGPNQSQQVPQIVDTRKGSQVLQTPTVTLVSDHIPLQVLSVN